MNIDVENWKNLEEATFLFDPYIYSSDEVDYQTYFHNQEFVDCTGHIYKIVNKGEAPRNWRKYFRFLPNVFKVELVFQKTSKSIDVKELKRLLATGVAHQYGESELTRRWLIEIQKCTSIKEILNLEDK